MSAYLCDDAHFATLAVAYAAHGQFDPAFELWSEAEALARKQGLADFADQIRRRAETCRKGYEGSKQGNHRK